MSSFEKPRAYQRAERRAEIYQKRITDYRSNITAGPLIRTWGDAVIAQEKRAKHVRAFSRLDGQLQEHIQDLPDQNETMRALEANVAALTWRDDTGGLGDSAWMYDGLIEEYRDVKRQEWERTDLMSQARELREEAAQLNPNRTTYLNPEARQVIIEDRLVTFENPKDWEVFRHFVENRNRDVLPGDIRRIAVENGGNGAHSSASSVRKLREIIGDNTKNPRVITTNSHGRGASYSFAPAEARFFYPSKEMQQGKAVGVNEEGKVVNLDQFRQKREDSRRREVLLRRFPDLVTHIEKAAEDVLNAPAISSDKLASLDQVGRAFSGLRIEYILYLQQKGYISPQLWGDGYHPGFTIGDITTMLVMKRHGEDLNLTPSLARQLTQMARSQVEKLKQERTGELRRPTPSTQR